jgi:mRNA interferase HicA
MAGATGATFQLGKGSHLKVFLNGRQSTLPMHGNADWAKDLKQPSSVSLD